MFILFIRGVLRFLRWNKYFWTLAFMCILAGGNGLIFYMPFEICSVFIPIYFENSNDLKLKENSNDNNKNSRKVREPNVPVRII